MADDIELCERVARLEAELKHYAICADVGRLERDVAALRQVINLYIQRHDYHNEHLDNRVNDLMADNKGFAKEMGVVKVFALSALGLGVTILGAAITGVLK